MSRNSKKINRKPNPDYKSDQPSQKPAPPPKPPTKGKFDLSSLSNLSFVVSTDEVSLPSGGQYYPKSSPLCGVEKVEIKHMTAKEEDLLSNAESENSESLFDKLIDSILVDNSLDSSMFLEEDKMALLLKARETGYGKEYSTLVYCDNCKNTSAVSFDISKVGVKPPLTESNYDPVGDCFEFHLKMMDIKIKIKKLSSLEREELKKDQSKKESLGLDFNYTISFLKKCIISFEETTDPAIIAKIIELMPARDAKSILEFEMSCMPRIDTTQEIACGKCGHVTEREVPFSWAFFRTDV